MRIFILTFRQRGLHEGNRIKTCVASQFTFNTTYRRNAVTMSWLPGSGRHIRLHSQFTCTLCVSITWPNITSQFACTVGCPETIDLFTDTAAILNSIVLTEKLWAAEGAIAGKFIVYTAFRINFYCLSLIFLNKYYKRYIFPSRYLAVVPMVIEKLLLKVITPQYSF